MVTINNPETLEKMIFVGRLPRSAEFALMLENINAVEETPATKKRRQFIARITTFGQIFAERIPFEIYKPRDRRWTLDRRNRK